MKFTLLVPPSNKNGIMRGTEQEGTASGKGRRGLGLAKRSRKSCSEGHIQKRKGQGL